MIISSFLQKRAFQNQPVTTVTTVTTGKRLTRLARLSRGPGRKLNLDNSSVPRLPYPLLFNHAVAYAAEILESAFAPVGKFGLGYFYRC